MESQTNISGISANLSDSIEEQKTEEIVQIPTSVLHGQNIAVSVSESDDLEELGLSEHHLKDISIEIARYLLVNGAKMLYGGDLRKDGFTGLFSELSYQYKNLSDRQNRFINYFPFPTSKSLTKNDIANFLKMQVDIRILEYPKHLGEIDTNKIYDPFTIVEDRFILAECLSDMRIRMASESNARIILGGRETKFIGYFPGIVEEAYHTLNAKKPVYLLGGFGGATNSIISIVSGNKANRLTNEFQFDTDFSKKFKKFVSGKSTFNLDYDFVIDFFRHHSVELIARKNGLSIDENQILFESTNIHEIVFLIIKGLTNVTTQQK
jgi:hypothetical protein